MIPRQTDLIRVTRCGVTFTASRRTVAHIDYTLAAFRAAFPHAILTIIQSCYHKGVAMSAGTHDYDAVLDFGFEGHLTTMGGDADWRRLERFLRIHGWAAFWRNWPGDEHVHAISLPRWVKGIGYVFHTVVGYLIDGGMSLYGRIVSSSQVHDYVTGLDALADHAPDHDWRPNPQPVFSYKRWTLAHGIPLDGSVR